MQKQGLIRSLWQKVFFSAFNSFCQIRTYISKKINKALWYFYGPWENFSIAHKGMLTILRPLPSTLLIVSHVRLQSLLYSWHLSLKHFFSCCPHKVSIHCIIFFSFSFLSGFPQLFIKQFGFMFSRYYQCFRHPGVKRSIFPGRIYIFSREWTFETVINRIKKKIIKCTVLIFIQKNFISLLTYTYILYIFLLIYLSFTLSIF